MSKEKTLWVKWINTERLKGKSIWMANAGSSSSAGWKDLLKLRDKVRDHVLWKIGNGTKVSAWNDRWDSLGHLSDTISSRDIHEAGLIMESTLAELVNINNGAGRVFGTRIVWKVWSYYGAKMEWYPVICEASNRDRGESWNRDRGEALNSTDVKLCECFGRRLANSLAVVIVHK
ncbi:hypothetical protein Tco_0476302 [Tanacetum coccineum]